MTTRNVIAYFACYKIVYFCWKVLLRTMFFKYVSMFPCACFFPNIFLPPINFILLSSPLLLSQKDANMRSGEGVGIWITIQSFSSTGRIDHLQLSPTYWQSISLQMARTTVSAPSSKDFLSLDTSLSSHSENSYSSFKTQVKCCLLCEAFLVSHLESGLPPLHLLLLACSSYCCRNTSPKNDHDLLTSWSPA